MALPAEQSIEKLTQRFNELEKKKMRHTLKIVPGTHHGYQFAARPDYEPSAAEATWDDLFALWERNLR